MTFEPPKGPGRCRSCGWHVPTQSHREGCPAGRCRRCNGTAYLTTRLCERCLRAESERKQANR